VVRKELLSVVIPGKNQAVELGKTIDDIIKHVPKLPYNVEIIYVDGHSSDGSVKIANSKKNKISRFEVFVDPPGKGGKGSAVKSGIYKSKGDFKMFMDADNSTNFNQVDKLLKYVREYDIVIGSRYTDNLNVPTKKWFPSFFRASKDVIDVLIYGHARSYTAGLKQGRVRQFISRGGNLAFTVLLGQCFTDSRCGFKIFSKKAADTIFPLVTLPGFGFDTEVLVIAKKYGFSIVEVPVDWNDEEKDSNITVKDVFKSFFEIIEIQWKLFRGYYNKKSLKDEVISRKKVYLNSWIYPVLIGLFLRLYKIGSGVSHDEGYTLWLSHFNLEDIILRTARDVHPPFYYMVVKLWTFLFGGSILAIRGLSLVVSIGTIYLVYILVQKIFNKRAAFWSSLFAAFSPLMIHSGQEARMYGLVAFLVTLGTYFLFCYVKDKNDNFLLAYLIAMILAVYTQYYAFLAIIVHWFIVLAYSSKPGIKGFIGKLSIYNFKWIIVNLIIIIFYGPWFSVVLRQFQHIKSDYWILPEWMTIETIPKSVLGFATFNSFVGNESNINFIYGVLGIFLVLITTFLFFKKPFKEAFLMFIYAYLPMVIVFLFSLFVVPVYENRYFVFSGVALLIIWGSAVSSVSDKKLRLVSGLGFLIVFSIGINFMHKEMDIPMDELYKRVIVEKKEGDVVFSESLYTFLNSTYYFGDKEIKLIYEKASGYGESSLFWDRPEDYMVKKGNMLNSGNRIWIIGRRGEEDPSLKDILSNWNKRVVFEENKDKGIKATLYTR